MRDFESVLFCFRSVVSNQGLSLGLQSIESVTRLKKEEMKLKSKSKRPLSIGLKKHACYERYHFFKITLINRTWHLWKKTFLSKLSNNNKSTMQISIFETQRKQLSK